MHDDVAEEFYNYWDDLQSLIFISEEGYTKVKNENRRNIVSILSNGINDDVNGKIRNRKVMNAIEIQKELDTEFDATISKSNMYFHLGILVESGMIKIVRAVKINEGRGQKFMSYYGRSAKLYLEENPKLKNITELSMLENKSSNNENNENLLNFLIDINPDLDQQDIEKTFDSVLKMNRKNSSSFQNYFKKYENKLNEHKVDLRDLFITLFFTRILDSDVHEGINDFKRLLDY